ncbi:MAG TPA: branched-chain amino acid ABC transporter permease [Nocardioides sp.]
MNLLADALAQGIMIGAVYALITLGLAVIHAVSGVLNFAHGHLVVLSMYLTLILGRNLGVDPYLAGLIVVPLMFVIGMGLYLLIFRRLTGSPILTVAQATLGLLFFLEGALLLSQGGQFQRIHAAVDGKSFELGTVVIEAKEAVAFGVALIATALLFVALSRTYHGRSVRAVVQNPHGAQLVGININRVRVVGFGLGVALAALAGVLLVPGTGIHPSNGLGYAIVAIIAFYVGGIGNLFGALLGGMLLGLSESVGAIYVSGSYGFILPYALVVLVLLVRPKGLLAKRSDA